MTPATRRDLLVLSALGLAGACVSQRRPPRPALLPPALPDATGQGRSIVVCGREVPIGAPVVTWRDPGGYDAYSTELRFPEQAPADPPSGPRYRAGRELPDGRVITREDGLSALQEAVDQFVVHYDVCGTSRTCFRVLHDQRKLSVHFLLDVDGTLYQTLDACDTAWHARQANPRSLGVEIANIGAYPPGRASPLDEWYVPEPSGLRLRIPPRVGQSGVRTPDFVGRPQRPARVRGTIQGQELEMADFTPQQYHTLALLVAALTRVFPRLEPDAPRYPDGPRRGQVRREVLSDEELRAFRGVLGHWHVSRDKVDPGPAFDWEAFLRRVRTARERPAV